MYENAPTTPQRYRTEQEALALLRIPRPIDVTQLQSTATTVTTARSDADMQIEALYATNVTATDESVTVYLVPDGGSAGTDNLIMYQVLVPAQSGVTLFDRERQGLLQPLMTLQALCDTNDAVNVWGYGFDYQGQYGA